MTNTIFADTVELQQQIDAMESAANKLVDGVTDLLDYEDWAKIQKLYKEELDTLGVI